MADAAVDHDIDHERHRKEEAERRAKRKASKGSKSKEQLEKDRKLKEYRQAILKKHGQVSATSKRPSSSSKSRPSSKSSEPSSEKKPPSSSKFQELFDKRTQGFQIDFLFRNAPPRPPVGPCFVGQTLDSALLSLSKTYDPNNAVEANHIWKLHHDSSLGYPLAPSAMDPKSYEKPKEPGTDPLHKDDAALLDWKGGLGDSLAEAAHRRKEEARAAARLVASGQSPARLKTKRGVIKPVSAGTKANKFSRVLKDDIQQPWMKKTTYLSNDYSRKVHDFKSLAKTKAEMAADLAVKQEELNARRSAVAIRNSFSTTKALQHPHRKQMKPKRVMSVLPQTKSWGRAFTHVVIDKAPTSMPDGVTLNHLTQSFVTNVQKPESSSRLACSVQVPALASTDDKTVYRPAFEYDLEVVPLKQEDVPHMTFCFMMEGDSVTYVPVASRVQLMTGRPAKKMTPHPLERRPLTMKEQEEMEERMAEIDQDMAEKHHISKKRRRSSDDSSDDEYESHLGPAPKVTKKDDGDDDGMNDYADSDSDDD